MCPHEQRKYKKKKAGLGQHSDQQRHLLTVESLLIHQEMQMVSQHLYIFRGRILKGREGGRKGGVNLRKKKRKRKRKEKRKKKAMTTTRNSDWKNFPVFQSLYYLFLGRARKNTVTELRE